MKEVYRRKICFKRCSNFIGKVDNKFFSITLIYSLFLFLSYFYHLLVCFVFIRLIDDLTFIKKKNHKKGFFFFKNI